MTKIKTQEWWTSTNPIKSQNSRKDQNGFLICTILKETEKAILVQTEGKGLIGLGKQFEFWIPKSVITERRE
jgi:hypothetical protein